MAIPGEFRCRPWGIFMAIDNIYMYSTGILAIYVATPVAIEGILAKVVNGCKWT